MPIWLKLFTTGLLFLTVFSVASLPTGYGSRAEKITMMGVCVSAAVLIFGILMGVWTS